MAHLLILRTRTDKRHHYKLVDVVLHLLAALTEVHREVPTTLLGAWLELGEGFAMAAPNGAIRAA